MLLIRNAACRSPIGGFAASDGLIIHKKFQDSAGKVITEGNAVLPPDAVHEVIYEAEQIGLDLATLTAPAGRP